MKHMLDLLLLSYRIRIFSNCKEFVEHLRANVEEMSIPGVCAVECERTSIPDTVVTYIDHGSEQLTFDSEGRSFFLSKAYSHLHWQDLEYILLLVCSRICQKNQRYIVHSVNLEKGERGIAILGDRGSGKSIAGLSLALEGYRIVGLNRAVYGLDLRKKKVVVMCGSLPLRLRLATITRYFPQLLERVPKQQVDNEWTHVVHFSREALAEFGVHYCTEQVPLSVAFFVNVTPVAMRDCTSARIDELYLRPRLYSLFSEYIAGYKAILASFNSPMMSLDNLDLARTRLAAATMMCHKVPVYQVMGNLEYVCETIREKEGSQE